MAYSILLAEDDSSIAKLLHMALTASGYCCRIAEDGHRAKQLLVDGRYDLALLDIMLPGLDGYQLLDICKENDVPVIFVTAKTNVTDKVHGLRLGAEDYIAKPFELLEVLARVEVVLRRRTSETGERLLVADVQVDCIGRKVYKMGELITLTPKEYELLAFLLQNPNIAFSRESLLRQVWGYDFYGSTRTVDTHILNLRTKLGLSNYIQTVHKVGYRLELM
ncbi:DNA-binding response regulator [Brevibacillus nitrificans]|uniref:DNA-binding response regulator n=1 Tax=Brevibacillus nitrificans TaxID=651560 RepID=A0A3M8CTB8_9BACL|nr:response regulator transcription factor [Brevibacillus nitrificans]RNB78095.1 DNA-binding response regulator [Brevibacillus nitrificans]